ncbi:MAG: peptide deformylase [Candidatus Tectomicrobia bacterium]|nr:peptide deformylase [Candidatus Tectomicrobia bacterium]
MAVLPIFLYPDPILREKSLPVKAIDEEIISLIEDMSETMRAAPGVGLAAPQVGVSQRIIVIDTNICGENQGVLALINPRILSSEGTQTGEEGCLSIPNLRAEVTRAAKVEVVGRERDWSEVTILAEGFFARALQHEIDHLDGILFLDRLGKAQRDLLKRKLRKTLTKQIAQRV